MKDNTNPNGEKKMNTESKTRFIIRELGMAGSTEEHIVNGLATVFGMDAEEARILYDSTLAEIKSDAGVAISEWRNPKYNA